MRTFLKVLGVIAVAVIAMWLTSAIGWTHFRFWAPKYEEARREVFTETPSYVMGKNQFLARLKREWSVAEDENHRSALCELARHEAATIDPEDLTPDLRSWRCTQ